MLRLKYNNKRSKKKNKKFKGHIKIGFLAKKDSVLMINKSKFQISTQVNIVGFILVMMSGWINTVGIDLFFDESSAFMSGRGLTLGYFAFMGDMKSFLNVLLIIVAFIIGACISTIITKRTGLVGGLLFTGMLVIIAASPINIGGIIVSTIIIPMAMGAQNAATSLTSVNRTTHLTGPATDIGINIAKGNWNVVKLWILRWIGFPIGSFIGFKLVYMVSNNELGTQITLLIPGIIIILTGVIQRLIFNIPLLDTFYKKLEYKELEEETI